MNPHLRKTLDLFFYFVFFSFIIAGVAVGWNFILDLLSGSGEALNFFARYSPGQIIRFPGLFYFRLLVSSALFLAVGLFAAWDLRDAQEADDRTRARIYRTWGGSLAIFLAFAALFLTLRELGCFSYPVEERLEICGVAKGLVHYVLFALSAGVMLTALWLLKRRKSSAAGSLYLYAFSGLCLGLALRGALREGDMLSHQDASLVYALVATLLAGAIYLSALLFRCRRISGSMAPFLPSKKFVFLCPFFTMVCHYQSFFDLALGIIVFFYSIKLLNNVRRYEFRDGPADPSLA